MAVKNYVFGLKIDKIYCPLSLKFKIIIFKNKITSVNDAEISFDNLAYRMAQNFNFDKDETIKNCNHFIAEVIGTSKVLISPERHSDYEDYYNNMLSFNELFLTQNLGV